jgi:hypothetical protein
MHVFKTRQTTQEDYPTFVEYWKWFRFPPPPIEILPNFGKDGVVVLYKDEIVCAGYVYSTSSPYLFHCEWIISNPNIKDKSVRKEALNLLLESINKVVSDLGGKAIFTSLKNESLVERYKDAGYTVGSTGCLEMIKII